MSVGIVTGSCGLVGSETTRLLCDLGMVVAGIDNDTRAQLFGQSASTRSTRASLEQVRRYQHHEFDIRNATAIDRLFRHYGRDISFVIHAAAQPAHDWAAKDPLRDFDINARATLLLLEATRRYCPAAIFLLVSTNKVYGDHPNRLPLLEEPTRWTVSDEHPFAGHGINEQMPIDRSLHTLFGVSKLAADIATQEYASYFGLQTVVFRPGCLTGGAHAAVEHHGFLGHLVRCSARGIPYTVYGYGGKQVRDNLHARDLAQAFVAFLDAPRPGEVYNIGGGHPLSCSILEAIEIAATVTGNRPELAYRDEPRRGDHIWWVTDARKFQSHFPHWAPTHTLIDIVKEIADAAACQVLAAKAG